MTFLEVLCVRREGVERLRCRAHELLHPCLLQLEGRGEVSSRHPQYSGGQGQPLGEDGREMYARVCVARVPGRDLQPQTGHDSLNLRLVSTELVRDGLIVCVRTHV